MINKIITLIFIGFLSYKTQAQSVTIDSAVNLTKIDTIVLNNQRANENFESVLKYFRNPRTLGPNDIQPLTSSDPTAGKISFVGTVTTDTLTRDRKNSKDIIDMVVLLYNGTIYAKDGKYKILLHKLEYKYGYKKDASASSLYVKYEIDNTPLTLDNNSFEATIAKKSAVTLIKYLAQKTNFKSDATF